MTTINNLSTIDSVSSGDQVPVFDESAGTARKMSVSQLLAFFSANFASPEFEVQTAAPTLTGFTLTLTASAKSIWALLSPTGGLASGTVVLPAVADCFDGQEVLVTSSQNIAALTVNGNGATVSGAPAGLAANGAMRFRYRTLMTSWRFVAAWGGLSIPGNLVTFLGQVTMNDTLNVDSEVTCPILNVTEIVGIDNELFTSARSIVQSFGTVGTLPAAAFGSRSFVTDANATTFNSVVAGGGSNFVPVFSDGTNWRIG